MALWLDRDSTDLRWEMLGIPYSRLTLPALVQSAKDSSRRVLSRLQEQGRYVPAMYSVRSADRELYDRWQIAYDPNRVADRRATLVPVVSGAGMGKTSLVAHFVANFGGTLPVVFLEARHLTFTDEQTLVRAVITELQGVLAPEHRVQEEAALVRQLGEELRLTVVLDAIDEATALPRTVAQAIEFWLESRLGRSSVLILTSRLDAWRLLGPERWPSVRAHEPRAEADDWRDLRGSRTQVGRTDALPRRFTAAELESAWVRAKRGLPELYILPGHVRGALTHPFTLGAYLKLTASVPRPDLTTQAAIVTAWLEERLEREADTAARLGTPELARALEWTASRLEDRATRWLTLNDFMGAPRFSEQNPPGPAIECLLSSSVLEAHPGDPGLIGFAEEAVFDHVLASVDAKEVAQHAAAAVERLKALSFTRARHRVERLSALPEPALEEFARALNATDPTLAAVAVSAAPLSISPTTRAAIAGAVGTMLTSANRVDAAFAIELLGRMRCHEAEAVLLEWYHASANCLPALRAYGAMAFLRLDSVAGARAIYEYPWLAPGRETRFFVDLFGMFRRASSLPYQRFAD